MFCLLILISLVGASGCHPECRYACDDPVCSAICEHICEDPVCQFNQTCGYSPSCSVRCPADMCESDACPQCETICSPPPVEECGDVLCEETVCAWKCRKPFNCPLPRCELNCEHPACEYTGNTTSPSYALALGLSLGLSGGMILMIVILLFLVNALRPKTIKTQ